MRARLGIDKTKLWADWAEEEEEAAELTKTLEAATAEQFKQRLLLGVRLRGGAVESESGHESGEESGGEGEKGGGEGGGEDGGEECHAPGLAEGAAGMTTRAWRCGHVVELCEDALPQACVVCVVARYSPTSTAVRFVNGSLEEPATR